MNDWAVGYVTDVSYTYGYYPELNPLRAKLALLNTGLACPDMGTACELGFGQGVSVNIHGASGTTSWYGTDFNPAQAGFAKELADIAGAGTKVYDESFAEFCNRADLPDFDYIGLHGIWSWISDDNRKEIVNFVRRRLKIGGVLFISYNIFPGWSQFAPVRHLLTEHARTMGSEGAGIVKRIDGALDFTEKLFAVNPHFKTANPQVETRLQRVREMSRHYLAHEYFNRDWRPMHFSEIAELLEGAKVTYACPARFLEHVDAVNLTNEQQAFLREIPDATFRESVRDFMRNQQFRCDYWVKGARHLDRSERDRGLADMRFILGVPADKVPFKVAGGLGEVNLKEDIYKPMLDLLSDYKPKSLRELASGLANTKILNVQLLEMLLVMTGAGHVCIAQNDEIASQAQNTARKLNAHFMQKAVSSDEIGTLASPIIGGGAAVGRFPKLFLLARTRNLPTPQQWASFAWDMINSQGQKIVKEGKTLMSAEENLAELLTQANEFEKTQLPVLQGLGIA